MSAYASETVTAAGRLRDHLEAEGVGIAVFGITPDDEREPWAVAVVLGAENVAALSEWHDEQVSGLV